MSCQQFEQYLDPVSSISKPKPKQQTPPHPKKKDTLVFFYNIFFSKHFIYNIYKTTSYLSKFIIEQKDDNNDSIRCDKNNHSTCNGNKR